jgi:hypothetical protein
MQALQVFYDIPVVMSAPSPTNIREVRDDRNKPTMVDAWFYSTFLEHVPWYKWQSLLWNALFENGLQLTSIQIEDTIDALKTEPYFEDIQYCAELIVELSEQMLSTNIHYPNSDVQNKYFATIDEHQPIALQKINHEIAIVLLYNLSMPPIKPFDVIPPVFSPKRNSTVANFVLYDKTYQDNIRSFIDGSKRNTGSYDWTDVTVEKEFDRVKRRHITNWTNALNKMDNLVLNITSNNIIMNKYTVYYMMNVVNPPPSWFDYLYSDDPLWKSPTGRKSTTSNASIAPTAPLAPPTSRTIVPATPLNPNNPNAPFPTATAIPIPSTQPTQPGQPGQPGQPTTHLLPFSQQLPGYSLSSPSYSPTPLTDSGNGENEEMDVEDNTLLSQGLNNKRSRSAQGDSSDDDTNDQMTLAERKSMLRAQATNAHTSQSSTVPQSIVTIPTGNELNEYVAASFQHQVDMYLSSSGSTESELIVNDLIKFVIPNAQDNGTDSNMPSIVDDVLITREIKRTSYRYQGPVAVTQQDVLNTSDANPFGIMDFKPDTTFYQFPGSVTVSYPTDKTGFEQSRLTYTGEWSNGLWNGSGVLTFPYYKEERGGKYIFNVQIEGDFLDGKLHGRSKMKFVQILPVPVNREATTIHIVWKLGNVDVESDSGIVLVETIGRDQQKHVVHAMLSTIRLVPKVRFVTWNNHTNQISNDFVEKLNDRLRSTRFRPLDDAMNRTMVLLEPTKYIPPPIVPSHSIVYRRVQDPHLKQLQDAIAGMTFPRPNNYTYWRQNDDSHYSRKLRAAFEIVSSPAEIQFLTSRIRQSNADIERCRRAMSMNAAPPITTNTPTLTNAIMLKFPGVFDTTLEHTKLPPLGFNEQFLFHQTKEYNTYHLIVGSKFKHNTTDGRFGAGNYFADNINKAANYHNKDDGKTDLYEFLKLEQDLYDTTNLLIGARVSLGCSFQLEHKCRENAFTIGGCRVNPETTTYTLGNVERKLASNTSSYLSPIESLSFVLNKNDVNQSLRNDPSEEFLYNEFIIRDGQRALPTYVFVYDRDLSPIDKNTFEVETAVARS